MADQFYKCNSAVDLAYITFTILLVFVFKISLRTFIN